MPCKVYLSYHRKPLNPITNQPMPELILTDQTFQKEVLESPASTLVDFWAPWCGPCRLQGPIIEELAGEVDAAKFRIGKLNVDENPESAQKFGVLSIPTLAIFKNGQVVETFVGVQPKEKLKAALEKHAA